MSVKLVWSGKEEFTAMLRQLPKELAEEGQEIVEAATEITAAQLTQSYPLGDTGNLRRGVTISTEHYDNAQKTIGIVRSRSPHAHLWEFGAAVRATRQGWNRGKSPSHERQGLAAIAPRNRKTMNEQLVALVRKAGFEVSGEP